MGTIWGGKYKMREYRIWKQHNPGLDPSASVEKFRSWIDQLELDGAGFDLEPIEPLVSKKKVKMLEEPEPSPSRPGNRPKIAESLKSDELKEFDNRARIAAGRPGFAVYRIDLAGNAWYRGSVQKPDPEAVGIAFGGGSFEIRTVNRANGLEEVGVEKSFRINVDPSLYPIIDEFEPSDIFRRRLTRLRNENSEGQDVMDSESLENFEKKIEEKHQKDLEIIRLKTELEGKSTRNNLDDLKALAEIFKAMSPAPAIGMNAAPKSVPEIAKEVIGALSAVVLGGMEVWKNLKSSLPAPVSNDNMAASLINLIPVLMEARKNQQGQAFPLPPVAQVPAQPNQEDEMLKFIQEISEQTETDFRTGVSPIATANGIRAKGGIIKQFIDGCTEEQLFNVLVQSRPGLFYRDGDTRYPVQEAYSWASILVKAVKGQAVSQ